MAICVATAPRVRAPASAPARHPAPRLRSAPWPAGSDPPGSAPLKACHYPQVRRAQISAAVWQAGLLPCRGKGARLRFSKSTGFSTVAQDRGEGALVASKPRSRYAPIPEPEPNTFPTTSKPPSGPLQAYYRPAAGRCGTAVADARGGPPLGPNGRGELWPDQPGYDNATGCRPHPLGWESGLGRGCYRQATANDVSKRRPNFHHQLP
jgi:hypothetical protein